MSPTLHSHQSLGVEKVSRYSGLPARGEIVIDDRGQTNLAGVFAAGDATTEPFKQIVIAMGAGSTAALSAFDFLIRHSAPADAAAA